MSSRYSQSHCLFVRLFGSRSCIEPLCLSWFSNWHRAVALAVNPLKRKSVLITQSVPRSKQSPPRLYESSLYKTKAPVCLEIRTKTQKMQSEHHVKFLNVEILDFWVLNLVLHKATAVDCKVNKLGWINWVERKRFECSSLNSLFNPGLISISYLHCFLWKVIFYLVGTIS
jgi:hypothetical protein